MSVDPLPGGDLLSLRLRYLPTGVVGSTRVVIRIIHVIMLVFTVAVVLGVMVGDGTLLYKTLIF